MKRSLLSRLRSGGVYYIIGALILIIGVPLYQGLILNPMGYSSTISARGADRFASYLTWINTYTPQFLIYRVLLIIAFVMFLSLPFNLFRIIVAQEVIGQQEREEAEREEVEREGVEQEEVDSEEEEGDGMPAYAWRGKGFVVIAAWAALGGLLLYMIGAIVGSFYLVIVSKGFTLHTSVPDNFTTLYGIFSIISNTAGIGLLALATLFFGAMIARSGRHLWPTPWVLFGYMAIAVTAFLSGSAVAIANDPTAGQAALTTPAILLFGLWVLWLGIMLVRLKPE